MGPDFYDEYGLDRVTKLEHEVEEAVWEEDTGQWRVHVKNLATGTMFKDMGDFVVNATRFLNKWIWPDIQGIDTWQMQVRGMQLSHAPEAKRRVGHGIITAK